MFFNAVWALTSGGFRIVSDTLVNSEFATDIVKMSIFIFLFFLLAISLGPPSPISTKSSRKMAKVFGSELFRGEREKFNNVTFASDPASQNASWRLSGFNYRKELSDFDWAMSLPENHAKICQRTAEILWCMHLVRL